MAKRLLVTIIHPPYGHENAFAGLFIAMAALSKGLDVIVLLNCDGVFTALKEQREPLALLHLPSIEKQLGDILEMGGRIVVDRGSAELRGLAPEECVDGLEFIPDDEVVRIIQEYGTLVVTL